MIKTAIMRRQHHENTGKIKINIEIFNVPHTTPLPDFMIGENRHYDLMICQINDVTKKTQTETIEKLKLFFLLPCYGGLLFEE